MKTLALLILLSFAFVEEKPEHIIQASGRGYFMVRYCADEHCRVILVKDYYLESIHADSVILLGARANARPVDIQIDDLGLSVNNTVKQLKLL